MIVVWIIIGLLLTILLCLLLVPVTLTIDTDRDIYCIRMPAVFSAGVVSEEEGFVLRIRIFEIFRRNVTPGIPSKKRSPKEKKERKKRGRRGRLPVRHMLTLARDIIRCFRVRRFELDLDTDDVVLNAILFPVCFGISNERIRCNINFDGKYRLLLIVRFQLGSFVRAGSRFFWKAYVRPAFNFSS